MKNKKKFFLEIGDDILIPIIIIVWFILFITPPIILDSSAPIGCSETEFRQNHIIECKDYKNTDGIGFIISMIILIFTFNFLTKANSSFPKR